jgi:hypothetical protein
MKKLNPLKLKNYAWKDIDVLLSVEEYVQNNQLAIMLYEKETWEYYTDLSVFVKDFENKWYCVLDVNNFPWAEEFVQRYNLWTLVDYVQSWFVSYPIYEMYLYELEKYDPEWVHQFIKDNGIEKPKNLFDRLKWE